MNKPEPAEGPETDHGTEDGQGDDYQDFALERPIDGRGDFEVMPDGSSDRVRARRLAPWIPGRQGTPMPASSFT